MGPDGEIRTVPPEGEAEVVDDDDDDDVPLTPHRK
jgi:hypothetical protein